MIEQHNIRKNIIGQTFMLLNNFLSYIKFGGRKKRGYFDILSNFVLDTNSCDVV